MRTTSATYKTNIAKRTKRRTFAKVIVDYTDPFLDPSIVVTPSGTAHASYPDQVANGKKDPTRKWFSLNGECLLDGTNYLMPPTSDTASEATTEVGWWSDEKSVARAQFARYIMDEALPDIPDNAAGTEYLSDFSADVDGFKPAVNEDIFAHWSFDADDGTDDSGEGNDLTLVNTPTFAPGVSGNAIVFNGVSQYAQDVQPVRTTDDSFSIAGWLYIDSAHVWNTTAFSIFIGCGSTQGSYGIVQSGITDNLIRGVVRDGTSSRTTGAYTITRDTWNHFVFVYDGTTRIGVFYANGVQVGLPASQADAGYNLDTTLRIGSALYWSGSGPTYSKMRADEVRIYDRALTQAEITNLYTNVAGSLSVASSELVVPAFTRGIYQKAFFSADNQLARFIIEADSAETVQMSYEQSGAWAGEETVALAAGSNIIDKQFAGTTTGLKIVGALTGEIRVSAIYIGTGARDDDLVNTLGTGGDVSVNGCLHETIGGHDYIRFPTSPSANSGVVGNLAYLSLSGFTRAMVIHCKMFIETTEDLVDQVLLYSYDGGSGVGTFFVTIENGKLFFSIITANSGSPSFLMGHYDISAEIESEHDYTFKINMDDATDEALQIFVDNVKKTLTYDYDDATRPSIPDQTLLIGNTTDLSMPSNMLIREFSIFPGTIDAYEVEDLIANGYITFGYFASNPTVEETFSARTVENLIVSGESEFVEYPQAFTVELYDDADTLLHTETVIDNDGIHWTKAIASHAGVVKAVLTITRWSKIGRYTKILEFWSSTYREYFSADIMSLDMLEESEVESASLPIGNISSRQLTVRLDNHDRAFDAGSTDPISAMLKPRRKVTAYLGALGAGSVIEYIPLGIFWTKEWNVPDDDIYAETVAFDLLDVMGQKETYNLGLLENKTLFDIIEAACTDFGLDSTQYVIDAALDVDVIPYAYFDRAISHREAIRIAAEAGLARVYIDRDGVLRVEGPDYLNDNKVSSDKTIAKSAYFRRSNPSRWSEVRNVIRVTTQPMAELAAEDVYTQDDITVPASGSITVSAKYSAPPVIDAAASLTTPPGGVSITSATYYPWGADVVIANSNGTDQLADLVINGKPLVIDGIATMEARDADSIIEFGELLYEFPDNVLVQTQAQAQAIADKILEYYAAGKRDLSQEWRGDPALELGDRITTDDSRTTTDDYWIVRQSLTWDGALSASHDARRAT